MSEVSVHDSDNFLRNVEFKMNSDWLISFDSRVEYDTCPRITLRKDCILKQLVFARQWKSSNSKWDEVGFTDSIPSSLVMNIIPTFFQITMRIGNILKLVLILTHIPINLFWALWFEKHWDMSYSILDLAMHLDNLHKLLLKGWKKQETRFVHVKYKYRE